MTLGVGLVGAGLIGRRRAAVVANHPTSRLVMVADVDESRARALASELGCRSSTHWQDVVSCADVDVVIASTFNGALATVSIGAAEAGKHVLCEKPFGRSAAEAKQIVHAVRQADTRLKVGFNLRFHPAIRKAHEFCATGGIGRPLYARAAYGHGGRPGYEREWRGNRELAGGGELLDQGVHVADLCRWFLGEFDRVAAVATRGVWDIGTLEDNAFALLWAESGVVATFHTSWTQWKNRFLFEVIGSSGQVSVEGLGGSYGPERLVVASRRLEGGPPAEHTTTFESESDSSWQDEWQEFVQAIEDNREPISGAADALRTMELIQSIYQAASMQSVVDAGSESPSPALAAMRPKGKA